MKRRDAASRGYSLTELLTVVAIVGLVALVALPAIMQLMPQYRIRSAATELASAVRAARQRAMSTRVPWKIEFIPTSDCYRYAMFSTTLPPTDDNMKVTSNWRIMNARGRVPATGTTTDICTAAVDLRVNTTNPFKDVEGGSAGSDVDLIFLRDGQVADNPAAGTTTPRLTFGTSPSVVFAVNSSIVRYNRYYISLTETGQVTVTAAKE